MEVGQPIYLQSASLDFQIGGSAHYSSMTPSPAPMNNLFSYYSAPTSPSTRNSSLSAVVPFYWEETPGTPKSDSERLPRGFEFQFSFNSRSETSIDVLPADELFDQGKIKTALKLPPRLQKPENSSSCMSPATAQFLRSPRSPGRFINNAFSSLSPKKRDYDPFEAAIQEEMKAASRREKGISETRPVSPLRNWWRSKKPPRDSANVSPVRSRRSPAGRIIQSAVSSFSRKKRVSGENDQEEEIKKAALEEEERRSAVWREKGLEKSPERRTRSLSPLRYWWREKKKLDQSTEEAGWMSSSGLSPRRMLQASLSGLSPKKSDVDPFEAAKRASLRERGRYSSGRRTRSLSPLPLRNQQLITDQKVATTTKERKGGDKWTLRDLFQSPASGRRLRKLSADSSLSFRSFESDGSSTSSPAEKKTSRSDELIKMPMIKSRAQSKTLLGCLGLRTRV